MSLVIKRTETNDVKNQPIHLLPCKIHQSDRMTASQEVPVDKYFCPYTTDDVAGNKGNALWRSSLRGRPLIGVNLSLPDNYVGLLCSCVETDVSLDNSTEVKTILAEHDSNDTTNQFMYWNWDRVPSREDPLLAAFDWVRVSEAIMTVDE